VILDVRANGSKSRAAAPPGPTRMQFYTQYAAAPLPDG
jgi:hypothetical protein